MSKMTKLKQAMQWAAAAAYALAIVVAGLGLSGCVDECPQGQSLRWTPDPSRIEVTACSTKPDSFYFCMKNLGYERVCK